MNDYSEVYLDAMKTLKSFYNHETKEDHVEAAKAAMELSVMATKLKVIAMEKVSL
jgi:hypothetical protein